MLTTDSATAASPSSRIRIHLTTGLFLLTGVGVGLLEMWQFSTADLASKIDYFADDAYYYFEIAWHWSRGHGSTFDLLNPTNGFHPLWMTLLVALAGASATRMLFLSVVVACSALLYTVSLLLFLRLLRSWSIAVWASPILVLFVYQRRLWFNGMETALLLSSILAVLAVLAGRWQRSSESGTGADLRLGFLLLLTVFARLDAVFFAALVLALDGLRRLRSRAVPWPRIAIPALPLTFGLPLYMLLNFAWFGVFSPISGRAKGLGASGENLAVVRDFFALVPVKAPLLRLLDVRAWLLMLILPALLVALWSSLRGAVETRPRAAIALRFQLLLLASCAIQITYYATRTSWPLWRWYYYYVPLLIVISLATLALCLARPLFDRHRVLAGVVLPLATGLLVAVLVVRAATYGVETPSNYKRAVARVVEQLHQQTDPSSVFAMGDRAGAMGFLLDRPLIQLEGLVNSSDFLQALQDGSVHDFIEEQGVDYLIYSGGPMSGGDPQPIDVGGDASCSRFTEPKFGQGPKAAFVVCEEDLVLDIELEDPGAMGGHTRVWSYRPELNPLP